MKLSKEMQSVLDAKSIKKENILYLPIARVHLDRIINGTKKVEFRALTPFYINKLLKVVEGVEIRKPLTHVLFQAGYALNVPRALVELKDFRAVFDFDEKGKKIDPKTISEIGHYIRSEGLKEGFVFGDEYIGIVLGKVIFKENYTK